MFEMNGKYTDALVTIDAIEQECYAQINEFLNNPAFTNPVAIMPDTHAGKGSVIGFTMSLGEQIIPNVVGVDIGCGVKTANIGRVGDGNSLVLDFEKIDRDIRRRVPLGFNIHKRPVYDMEHTFAWKEATTLLDKFCGGYEREYGIHIDSIDYDYDWFKQMCRKVGSGVDNVERSVGTLGGGNHFIEIGRDDTGDHWVTVHTGSRNFGLKIANYHQEIAIKNNMAVKPDNFAGMVDEIRSTYTGAEIDRRIRALKDSYNMHKISKDLMYLEGVDAHAYLIDMLFAQQYAAWNRDTILRGIVRDISGSADRYNDLDKIESVHNFIDFHDMIIRKGAIRSYENEKMIIPYNMRDGMIHCVGKSNAAWNYSAPHGAGRIMSRGEAKRTLKLDEFKQQMEGIFTTSVNANTLDEAPGVYKNMHLIEQAIDPTATIINRVKPVYNLKA